MAERGCGKRKPGGVYIESGLSLYGRPIEDFLIDPPQPLGNLKVCALGMKLFERDGLWHVIDWVGEKHYPNVADFIEETRRLGLSRRVQSNLDFSKLTIGSRIFLAHKRAIVVNHESYIGWACPKHLEGHEPSHGMCAGIWWHDLDGEPNEPVLREMPSFSYKGVARPGPATYEPGFFMSLPITNLVVMSGSAKTEQNLLNITRSELCGGVVDE